MKVSKDQHLKAERKCLSTAAAEWSVTRDQTPGTIWGYHTSTFFLKILANMYRERKTWSSRKFGESKFFFGEDGVFQMKEFRTTLSNRAFCWPRNMSVWPLLSVQVNAPVVKPWQMNQHAGYNAHMECPSQMDTPLLATLPQHKLANQSKPPNPEAFTNFTSWKNVNLYIHSLGIKTIAVWINTNNSTSPAPSLELKMYRSTVLGSKVYMYTDPQSWDQRQVYI